MTRDEAILGIGLTVRPAWATTNAHYILAAVLPGDMARLKTRRRPQKVLVERLDRLRWTNKSQWEIDRRMSTK